MTNLRAHVVLLALVFTVTTAVCSVFAVLTQSSTADWFTYRNVARSILDGCGVAVSFSGRCEPHFGGAHLPLYPALVALLWGAFGESESILRAFNILAFAGANVVLVHAVLRAGGSLAAAYGVGLLVALSPLPARWFGLLQTEPLALACTTLIAAELVLILALRRVRITLLAGMVVLATWVRLDGVLLLAPVGVALWMALGWRKATMPFIVIVAAIGITSGAWSLRNHHVGVRPFPTGWMLPDGSLGPFGYLAWLKTWVVTEDARGRASYFAINQYRRIDIDPSAFRRFNDRAEVEGLLERLRAAEGQPFPAEIDAAFARLAVARKAELGAADHAQLLVQRVWDMMGPWVFPFLRADGTVTAQIPAGSVIRTAHFWMFALGAMVAWRRRWTLGLQVCAVGCVLFVARAVFFGAGMGLEARYMVQVVPFLSLSTGMCLIPFLLQKVRLRVSTHPGA